MIFPVSHFNWQVLRAVLRAELAGGPPPLGRVLRLSPNRLTKEGKFLYELAQLGLLAVVGDPEPAADRELVPPPFRVRYAFTDLGRHAAEYGEYDRAFATKESPVTGKIAELMGEVGSRRPQVKGKEKWEPAVKRRK